MVALGERVGHVRIERRLGIGGMGEVYLGFDEKLEREVAVKTLGEHRRLDEVVKARFLREARILSRLDHPGICRIHGLVEGDESDFLILEYIEGRTLRELGSALTHDEILEIFAQVAEALAAAHAEDVVHRDLKPENIMVTPQQRAKVLDFGIARSLLGSAVPHTLLQRNRPPIAPVSTSPDSTDDLQTPLWPPEAPGWSIEARGADTTSYTREGALIGTVRYMSPEQARGEPVSRPADMYAVGVMLQELVTGRHPYGEARGAELLLRAARAETEPLEGVDREVGELIDELENLDPKRRPTAREASDRLRFILDRPLRARRRRTRQILAATLGMLVLGSAAAVGWTTLRARRRVTLAQRFAAEARDVTWMMRAEYLSPFHDLEPARQRARARARALSEQMAGLGSIADGPGELALGQVSLALGESQEAHRHLEAAWNAGVHTPEAAFARGVVLAELYRIGFKQSRRLSDPEARDRERQRLESELRDPALEMLRLGLDDTTTPPAYIEGLVALIEERWEDGLAAAARLKATAPWMYEAQLLEGQIHYDLGGIVARETRDFERELAVWTRARDGFREATEVARSHPLAWERLCGLEAKLLETRLVYSGPESIAENEFDRVPEACRKALVLKPENPVVLMVMAGINTVHARVVAARGDDPTRFFESALELAQQAVTAAPEEPAAHLFAGWVSLNLCNQQIEAGIDPSTEIERCIHHYSEAARLLPGDVAAAVYFADGHWLAASHALATGGDPMPHIEQAVGPVLTALEGHPDDASLQLELGNLLAIRGECEAARGGPAVETFSQVVDAYLRVTESSSNGDDLLTLARFERRLAQATLESGRDPSVPLEAARATLDRVKRTTPDLPGVAAETGWMWAVTARWAREQGRSPWPDLDRAIEALTRGDDKVASQLALALVQLDAARWRLEDGRPAGTALRSARTAAEKALELQPRWGEVHRVAGLLELLEGRWRAARGLDPGAAWNAAEARLAAALDRSYDDARVLALRAELQLERARWHLRRDQDPAGLIALGTKDGEAALELNPGSRPARDVLAALGALSAGS